MVKIKVSDLKEYDKNNKDHPQQQIDVLKKMISEYGFDSPIIVNKDNVIIAGHGRLKAIKELGWEEVDVIVKDKLTKKQEQKYRLLDNKIAELATSMPDNIKLELEELEDLELNELYPEIDLNKIELDEENEDTVPEPPKEAKLVKVGDIFQLGNHRIMCGDSTKIDQIETMMNGKLANMIHTDPPYGIKYEGGSKKREMIDNDDISVYPFYYDVFTNIALHSEKGASIYVRHASSETHNTIQALLDSGWLFKSYIVWNKDNSIFGRSDYHWKHEPAFYGWLDGGSHNWNGDRKQTTVWDIKRPSKSEEHPTMKPIELCEKAINNSSKEGNIVTDLFLGSGSTLIACEKTNRICYGMELDAVYIEVILKRYHDYTKGQKEIKCINRNLDLNIILNG